MVALKKSIFDEYLIISHYFKRYCYCPSFFENEHLFEDDKNNTEQSILNYTVITSQQINR